ncbi:MAG: 2-C-methyl-D-erythritol 2,4-cyclodiphosphate synthase [Stagnimonas sp.]|nr:2-C-methyl-D-erythritol 2,4-cyclodiphosphate synthase [Stagnimonas sp.]
MSFDMRIGHGFDIHRIEPGEGVTLGGVFIACEYRIIAHSDGDVLIHALCDALLGAIAAGDIGKLFPDNDPQFKGIDSRKLLRIVVERVRLAGFAPVNIDCTLVAEAPRVIKHVPAMCALLAQDLGIAVDRVNVKATTNEGMGHLGRKEGIAAHAVALLAASPHNG